MFNNCSKLTSVSFSQFSSVKSIQRNAFAGCTSLSQIALENSSVTELGSQVFINSGVKSIVLPATITSVSQIDKSFLAGSLITHVKFMGMTSQYMEQHKTEFTTFGRNEDDMIFQSSNGKEYKVNNDGLISAEATVYIISVAIANSRSNPLVGMYRDSQRFINLVNKAQSQGRKYLIAI